MGIVEKTVGELARDLAQRRRLAERPPVLLLGAGASREAGVATMEQLFAYLGKDDFEEFVKFVEPLTPPERYRYLSDFLRMQDPAAVTPGYRALAALLAQGYLDVVLTTNVDALLDDALSDARLWRKDYLFLINGVIRPDRLTALLRTDSPRVKILKLHGDLYMRSMAWTPGEMRHFLSEIAGELRGALQGRDILVVGYSMQDEEVREFVLNNGGSVWYTNPKSVPDAIAHAPNLRAVLGPDAKFENFFPELAKQLQPRPLTATYASPAPPFAAPAPPTGYGPPAPGFGTPAPSTSFGAPAPAPAPAPPPPLGAPAPAPAFGAPAPAPAPPPGFGAPAPSPVVTRSPVRGGDTVTEFAPPQTATPPTQPGYGASPSARAPDAGAPSSRGTGRFACTLDDVLVSVLGVATPGQPARGTGFVSSELNLIVIEPFAAAAGGGALPNEVEVIDHRGHRYRTRFVYRDSSHPFGPVFAEIPKRLVAPGLQFRSTPLQANLALEIYVAAGSRVGVTSGRLGSSREETLQVAPIGAVAGLLKLEFATSPGASGAPALDDEFRVCGYVVAGNVDGSPPSYMYPASRWPRSAQ